MRLSDFISGQRPLVPDKIPWDDPEFSRRMLAEHLSQSHDAASRRSERIDRQVRWIHKHLLSGEPTRILDLGCGPGLYTSRLSALGHTCVGVDFSPASVDYARSQDQSTDYVLGDIRDVEYGSDFGLVMLIFGELNVFSRPDAEGILSKVSGSLRLGGKLLLEPHTLDTVCRIGNEPRNWTTHESGLFSDGPHLVLEENSWNDVERTATRQWHVIDAETSRVSSFGQIMYGYTDEEYAGMLARAGFSEIAFHASMGEEDVDSDSGLTVITALKPKKD